MKYMKYPIIIILIMCFTTLASATSEPIVTCDTEFNITAGCRLEIPINITYSGDETTITFSSDIIEGINIEFSPNPVVTTTDTYVIMYINTSMLLAPEQYNFDTYYTIKTEDYSGGSTTTKTKKLTYISGTNNHDEEEEDPWYWPEPEEQPPRINVQDPPVYLKGQPESGIPVFVIGGILLFIILGSIIFFVWRKKKKN